MRSLPWTMNSACNEGRKDEREQERKQAAATTDVMLKFATQSTKALLMSQAISRDMVTALPALNTFGNQGDVGGGVGGKDRKTLTRKESETKENYDCSSDDEPLAKKQKNGTEEKMLEKIKAILNDADLSQLSVRAIYRLPASACGAFVCSLPWPHTHAGQERPQGAGRSVWGGRRQGAKGMGKRAGGADSRTLQVERGRMGGAKAQRRAMLRHVTPCYASCQPPTRARSRRNSSFSKTSILDPVQSPKGVMGGQPRRGGTVRELTLRCLTEHKSTHIYSKP